MKLIVNRSVLCLLFMATSICFLAQSKPATRSVAKYPSQFTITAAESQKLLKLEEDTKASFPENRYIDKCAVIKNSANGDMQFVRVKLSYFKNAFMVVQVNGVHSTQVFITSSDKKIFYKGEAERGGFIMKKCKEEDIVQE
jgi:hypothetical protein